MLPLLTVGEGLGRREIFLTPPSPERRRRMRANKNPALLHRGAG
jgi:hypothetical protein